MYFKKLEIFGFKSFADKTVLNFEQGITAVVGPNGCGKSNVFDSIRWVLGEQSSKELRGSSMADVVFNGTSTKPSLGFAEVSLTLSNKERQLDMDEDEIIITRRLFRSGESEYLLNKKTARLKDIHELLMGTGIGAQAYSMVQQGKVDLVVSSKPEERRMIFDEASGITKYKAKKKEALNKLKDTENNLLRVNDIVVEVKRQIGSIERQAKKAQKYKLEYDKLKDLEVKSAKYRLLSFGNKKIELSSEAQALREKKIQLHKEHDELSERLKNEISYLEEIEQKVNTMNGERIKLDGQIDLNRRQIEFNTERIQSLDENDIRLREQKEQLHGRCKVQQGKIEATKQGLVDIEWKIKSHDEKLAEKKEELTRLERQIRDARQKIKEFEEKTLDLTSKQVNLRNSLTDVMKELQGNLARKRRLDLENDKVISEKQAIDEKLESVDSQINTLQIELSELEVSKSGKVQIIRELNENQSAKEKEIHEQEKKKVSLQSQKEFIEKMHAQYQDIPDPIVEGKLITEMPPLEHHTGIIGKVKEVRPLPQSTPAPEGLFKSFFNKEDSKQLYEIICETKFIELDPQQISLRIEEVGEKIEQIIREKDQINARIGDEAKALEQLRQAIQKKEREYTTLEAQRKEVLAEVEKLVGELEILGTEITEVKEALVQSRKREEELNYELDTVNKDLGWCQNDIRGNQESIEAKSVAKEEVSVGVAQLETELNSFKEKHETLQKDEQSSADELDRMLDDIKKIDDDLVAQEHKKEQYQEEIETLQAKIEEIEQGKQSLSAEIEEHEREKEEVSQRTNSVRAQMKAIEDEEDQMQERFHEQEMSEQKMEFDLQAIKDRLEQTYKINIDDIPDYILRLSEDDPMVGYLKDEAPVPVDVTVAPELLVHQMQGAMSVFLALPSPKDAIIKTLSGDQQEIFVFNEAQEEIERLRKRCESFGSVNLVAIDEYEELKGRFEFLTSQQSDLLEAKSQLMSTITKINRSTRQMFMDTFTRVSEEFRIYFRMLFGGGEANLVLLDPENVLESGIDIVARPPGKKLQNISLLSGGEKTLTAIALIFGVFKVNPSPFCILDEIDAALDESNVGRFSYLLKDFAKIAQFIVITHNKKTMSVADVMYGVTMPETGVSRIVSVKFSDGKEELPTELQEPVGV